MLLTALEDLERKTFRLFDTIPTEIGKVLKTIEIEKDSVGPSLLTVNKLLAVKFLIYIKLFYYVGQGLTVEK